MTATTNPVAALLEAFPVVLAPMESVTDAAFRRLARTVGAELCVTEFVGAEQLVAQSKLAQRRAYLPPEDRPTAIQIYGADPDLLLTAARIAERAEPTFVDINCGCWVPGVAKRGAGAGWLRDPAAMVAMAKRVAAALTLPVTVKTRIGWGPESDMPIVDLARRLEDAGIAAITIHCRTAAMAHNGPADWNWARLAREVVKIPVIVNGDIKTADDVPRALKQTGCAGVMVGRAAIQYPWIFREARARLAGQTIPKATEAERRAMYRSLVEASVAIRGELAGVDAAKRYVGVLGPTLVPELKPKLVRAQRLVDALDVLAV